MRDVLVPCALISHAHADPNPSRAPPGAPLPSSPTRLVNSCLPAVRFASAPRFVRSHAGVFWVFTSIMKLVEIGRDEHNMTIMRVRN